MLKSGIDQIEIHFGFASFHFRRNRNHVTHLLRRNPNLDRDLLKRKYPDVDIEKIDRIDKARGHFVPKIEK